MGHERLCGLAGGRGIPRTGSRHPSRPQCMPPERPVREVVPVCVKRISEPDGERPYLYDFGGKPDRLVPPATARRRARHAHPSRIRRENQSRRNAFPHPCRQRDQRHGAGRLLHSQRRRPRDLGTQLHLPRIPVCGPLRRIGRTARSAVGETLTAVVVHTDLPETASFDCSDPQLVRLHRAAGRTCWPAMHGLPMDCPVRERCGWLGDGHAIAQLLLTRYDAASFLHKYAATSKPEAAAPPTNRASVPFTAQPSADPNQRACPT